MTAYAPKIRAGTGAKPVIFDVPDAPAKLPHLFLVSGDINPEALRWYRHVHGMTQEQLGDLLGVKRRTVAQWEQGGPTPRESLLAVLDMLVRATARTMSHYNGILPPHERLVSTLEQVDGVWRIKESDALMVKEVMARRSEVVEELEDEIARLRRENHELKSDIAYMRRQYRRRELQKGNRS